ncbi:MAG: hypothetical protein QOF03_1127 [Alphaproteobacteria bacterium]|jgi:hypothetical protein|nr:hypothetical protein [Alphaproteobacteria bacterium]
MKLTVENEEVGRRPQFRGRGWFEHLGRIDIEEAAEDVVHRHEGRRHSPACGEEAAPAHAKLVARMLGDFGQPCLDLFLF